MNSPVVLPDPILTRSMSEFVNGLNFGKYAFSNGYTAVEALGKAYHYGGALGSIGTGAALISTAPVTSTALGVLGALYGAKTIYDGIKNW
jgi:hypothetical protein